MASTNAELEAKVIYHRQELQAAINELNKRAREEYARLHHEIKTVNVNDKLSVTTEYNDWYDSHNRWPNNSDQPVGRIVTVKRIEKEQSRGETKLFVSTVEFGGLTPMRIAINMRRAYLERKEQ